MKTIVFFVLMMPLFLLAQIRTNAVSQHKMLSAKNDNETGWRKINGIHYFPMLAKVDGSYSAEELPEGVLQGSRVGNIVSLYIRYG
ncbi:MAG: hypothetical protein RB294_00840 [Bacteroidales bacterium]|jgi:hypothetical protein|nr:hypothetical protein [Bacteroidales bacterium]